MLHASLSILDSILDYFCSMLSLISGMVVSIDSLGTSSRERVIKLGPTVCVIFL